MFLPVTVSTPADMVGVGIVLGRLVIALGRLVIDPADDVRVDGVVDVPAELQAAATRTRPTEPRVSPRRREDVVIEAPVSA